MGEYLWVIHCGSVSAVRPYNSRCSRGHCFITLYNMEQTGVSIQTQCGVSYGCCKYFFSAYLTPMLFILRWHPNTTPSYCPCSREGDIRWAALSLHSGCDMRKLYDLNWITLRTLNTLQTGQMFSLTGALRAMGTTIILGSRASWWGQVHKDSFFPPSGLWQPGSIHSVFICA